MKEFLYNSWVSVMTKFGDLYLAFTPPACHMAQIEDLMSIAKGGDVILRGYDAYLDGKFIPGEYSHSGLVINERQVIHSIAEGVCPCHLGDFVIDTDRFILVRPFYLTPEDCWATVERALWHCEHNKTKYDFFFSPEGDKVYCHEFTVDCLHRGRIDVKPVEKHFGFWPIRYKKYVWLAEGIIDISQEIYKFRGKEVMD